MQTYYYIRDNKIKHITLNVLEWYEMKQGGVDLYDTRHEAMQQLSFLDRLKNMFKSDLDSITNNIIQYTSILIEQAYQRTLDRLNTNI